MLFNSYDFMFFFPVVTILYFLVPKRARHLWLLVASYYFYMSWNPRYAILILFSTFITYLSARVMETHPLLKKLALWGGLVINLGLLFFFKYFDFLLLNLNAILQVFHITVLQKPFDLLLPVGISFYTFQALGYTIDVYRGDIKAETYFFRYALFVSFFPQLIAGPIERSGNLLSQMRNIRDIRVWDYERVTQGAVLMLWGYFLKMVIADRAAIFVDRVYDYYWMYGSVELLFAAILFSIQIYCDFAAYSIIALGAAQIMGFRLTENFNTPYFASSMRDFWRRWHISLGTWLRDYFYIPLGGSRVSQTRKRLNLMATFLVSGLWHGASWSFVAWGGLHGVFLVAEEAALPYWERFLRWTDMKTSGIGYRLLQISLTFCLVTFAWIFFRMNDLGESLLFIERMLTAWNPWVLFDESLYRVALSRMELGILTAALVVLFLGDIVRYTKGMTIERFLHEECLPFRWLVLLALFFSVAIFGIYGPTFNPKQFIYFQF